MRFRLGFCIGFGTGYYLGAMAGRERYEKINKLVSKVKRSEALETAAEKAKAAVDLGVERARDAVGSKVGDGHGNAADSPYVRPPQDRPYP